MFESKWEEKAAQVVNSYPGGLGLVKALGALCQTAFQEGRQQARSEAAEIVCEGLHMDPPSGQIKCLDCYNAEQGMIEEIAVIAEKEANHAEDSPS